jgi:hypothetical protein
MPQRARSIAGKGVVVQARRNQCGDGMKIQRLRLGRCIGLRRCRCVAADTGKSNGLRSRQRPGGRYHRMRLSRPFPDRCLFPGAYRAQGPERLSIAAGHSLGVPVDQDCQSVRIYASDRCPRQDSNLRSRLRRAWHQLALTSGNVPTGDPSGHVLGTARIAAGQVTSLPIADGLHKPRSDRRVSLTLQSGIPHRLRRGWRAIRNPARVTGAGLALGAAGHPAVGRQGAEPNPVPTGHGGHPAWAYRSVVIVWASRRVSSPLVLTPPGFVQIA